ncbi:MAG: DUF188 domain-containing protein [Bacilli bacterium]
MTIFIGGDASPVIEEVIEICNNIFDIVVVCDDSHNIKYENIKTIIVEKGVDSSDLKIVSLVKANDLVVTNDYGLSSIILAKKTYVMDSDGNQVTAENIDRLLYFRAMNAKLRRNGVRVKGPKKRDKNQNIIFKTKLKNFLNKMKD